MGSYSKIKHSFHRALDSYNDQAIVQKKCATALISHMQNSGIEHSLSRVFEFGCGTGFLSNQLVQNFNIDEFIANDLVNECETYLPQSGVKFLLGNVDEISIPGSFDLICSASCAQWSSGLSDLIKRLTNALKVEGYLAISSFSTDHFKELAILRTGLSSNNPQALSYWSKSAWQDCLQTCYDIELITTQETVLWFDKVRDILLHLRLTGVNGMAGQAWNQQRLADFEERYRDNFEKNGKVPLSFNPIFVVAKKTSHNSS